MQASDEATAALVRVDAEICKQVLSLCDLRTRRNTLCLISRLPNETLATIFVEYARDDYPAPSDSLRPCYIRSSYPTMNVPHWVKVSYVCRRWRDVALNCPTLWTYLFVTSPRWTEEFLARSKQASLKIHVEPYFSRRGLGDDRAVDFMDQVKSHVERIQEFSLRVNSLTACRIFSKPTSRAPRLQKLRVSCYDTYSNSVQFPVPFGGDTPALRELEFSYCPVPWYLLKTSGLTALSLHGFPFQYRKNTEEFLTMLSCMQDLRHLYLDDALHSATGFLSSAEFHTFQKIDLPHLSRFSIGAPLSTIIAFLSCVNVPLKTEVRLQCNLRKVVSDEDIDTSEDDFINPGPSLYDPSVDDYTMFSSFFAPRFHIHEADKSSTPTIHSLIIQSNTYTFSASERHCGPSDNTSGQWGCNIPLQITFRLRNHARPSETMLNIYRSMPMTNVQSLYALDRSMLSPFFACDFPDLQYLKLSGRMQDLASVFSVALHHHPETGGEHVDRDPNWIFAPGLKELELADVMFMTRTELQSLYDALSIRKQPGGQLTMTQCIDAKTRVFDLVGQWGGGHFHVVEKRFRSPRPKNNRRKAR